MSTRSRQSFLTYEPTPFSLTDGTNIPPPRESPPATANALKPDVPNGVHKDIEADTEKTNGHLNAVRPSVDQQASPRPQSVRRLFSLSSLRSSFSSSRASLALPKEHEPQTDYNGRPVSPSASFVTAASSHPARPASRASHMTTRTTRKSGRWFKRKSGFWSSENGLASIGEDTGPDSKRMRAKSPAPLLPEISELAGGELNDGEVEWDDKMFKKPVAV